MGPQRVVWQEDGTWRQVEAEKALEKAGTQSLGTYIDRRQATVAEWVALRTILEVCDIETGYEGGGGDAWNLGGGKRRPESS